jgi:CHAT domain-containing protein/predicted negative regulator of RcsB-dependent stress response
MSSAFRASLLFLALSLILVHSAPAQSQSSSSASKAPPLIFGSPQSSDEATLRALTEKYGLAIAAGDLEAMRQFWDPQSPNLAPQLKVYQDIFSRMRFEFVSLKVTRLEVAGAKAVSHLTTDERQLEKKTGFVTGLRDVYYGNSRALEWNKTDAGWKIEREFTVQVQLAAKLEAAASDSERQELLEKEREFVTSALVGVLFTRGDRYRAREDYDKALLCYRLAQAVSEKIGDQTGVAAGWDYMGLVRIAQSDYEQALPRLRKSLALFEAAGDKPGEAITLEHLSSVYLHLGDYLQSFECAQKSFRLFEEANNPKGMAQALAELASVYSVQNNPQQALAHEERAMKIFEESEDIIQIAMLRNAMAREHLTEGHYERAIELYQQILKQTEGYRDRIGAAVIRDEIGRIYAAQGRYAEALNYYRQALSVLETSNSRDRVTQTLINLSNAYLADRQYAEARPFAERAASLARQAVSPRNLYSALTSIGYCQLGLNRPAEARQAFDEAVSIIEKLRAQAAGGVEERQRYFERGLDAYHGMLSLLAQENRPGEALIFAERSKARALLDVLENGRVSIQKAMTAEEREQERRLKSELTMLNTQLAHITQSGKPDPQRISDLNPRLEKARLDYEAFQTSLYSAHPELRTHRGDAPIIKAEELATLIPAPTGALLEYVVTDDATYLFVVTKAADKRDADVRVFTLPIKRAELASRVERFRQSLAERNLGFRDAARRLYDLLLKPADAQLQGKTNLVIAPDDSLWDLPFQALLADDKRYVLEKSAVSYAPSLTVLREMAKARGRGAETVRMSLLAFGNPALGEETVARAGLAVRDEKLGPLPEAEAEVKGLGRLYGAARSKIYVGAEAREDRVKSEAGAFHVLHFATHGVLNNAAPMYSHLVLAQGDKNDDGLLEAWELMQMDLRADLVVLSACDTARGRFGAGEGVIGLSWAMFVAGAPATVVSQWSVDSASTQELMLDFHKRLMAPSRKPLSKAEALRQAALKVMKSPGDSHPFYWAGFVLVGDGR